MSSLLLRHDACVLHLTLNRPEQRNAMSMEMVSELREALAAAQADGRTRAVVLRGAGGHFCAGADLADMARARAGTGGDALVAMSAAFGELCAAVSNSGLATVAVLEGTVMGGGLGLACVVDVAIAASTAVFRLPETSIGLVPAQIAPFLVERLGYSVAKRLAVTGATLDAQAALDLRLVHEVHANSALPNALDKTLQQILRCAPGAIAQTKALLARSRWVEGSALVQEAARVFAQAAQGPEGIEGTEAFLAKRKPAWASG
ncbi:MAG TPA: enoyl-CoA hydratase-related protein [Rubrivivax sp.]|jgi:isohexenylglutaconyl-CoA hydratase|nr:enoyl-CoA hydratase-related protein [Rubrivivax sp.]